MYGFSKANNSPKFIRTHGFWSTNNPIMREISDEENYSICENHLLNSSKLNFIFPLLYK